MISKRKTFSRGYGFNNFEGQPQDTLIQIGIPETLIVPLRQGFGNEVAPVVEPGQTVAAGQIIARDDESISSPVHSSVNGKVVQIEKIDYLSNQTTAVIIESDGADGWQKLEGYSSDWENLSSEKIEGLIYLSGAGSLCRAGIPTSFKSSVILPEQVEDVIIHGVESEMYNLSSAVLLKDEKTLHFADGVRILQKIMPGARFQIALNKSRKKLISEISRVLSDSNSIDICGLEPKYPLDHDEVLIPTLLGREFPYGYLAANIGVIVLDIQAILQVYEAVAEGKPLIERTVALCGGGFRDNSHVKVRLGTPLEHVVKGKVRKDKDLRFVINSSLTGAIIDDLSLPLDRTFSAIVALAEGNEKEFLSFMRPGFKKDSYSKVFVSRLFKKNAKTFKKASDTNLHGELRPCIFCSYCEQVCPVAIIPHLFFHRVKNDMVDETLLNYKIFNCIECNLCNYVCTSKIPISQYIKEGKERLIAEGFKIPAPKMDLKGIEEYKSIK